MSEQEKLERKIYEEIWMPNFEENIGTPIKGWQDYESFSEWSPVLSSFIFAIAEWHLKQTVLIRAESHNKDSFLNQAKSTIKTLEAQLADKEKKTGDLEADNVALRSLRVAEMKETYPVLYTRLFGGL